MFREILDHSENSIVEGAVDLASILDVLERSGNTGKRKEENKHESKQ